MILFGLILLLLGFITAFLLGLNIERINNIQFVISFIVLLCLYIFGVLVLAYETQYFTLLEYENCTIGYKVTEINVESGKATSIEVIAKNKKNYGNKKNN